MRYSGLDDRPSFLEFDNANDVIRLKFERDFQKCKKKFSVRPSVRLYPRGLTSKPDHRKHSGFQYSIECQV